MTDDVIECPRSRAARGEDLLSLGRYAEGFRLYDAWRSVPPYRDPMAGSPLPLWRGEDLSGRRLLVYGEQGLGDQIMFARFAKLLQAQGAEVLWLAPPALARLFNGCLGIPAATPGQQPAELGRFDAYCPACALPLGFFPPLSEPPGAPYLTPPAANVIPGLTVGIMARGNPRHVNDSLRSLTPEAEAALLALPGAVSLAPADTGARDFYDTATVVAGLDVVISVDTAVAHLAGAMGKPVWVLLPAEKADWRWLRDRADNPWYPTARLYRQTSPGDWMAAVERVAQALT